jgi:hypothetical protein
MPIPDGSVIITPAQQYAELRALTSAVEKLTNTMDPALADIRKDVDDSRADIKEIRTEVAALQRWRSALASAVLVLTTLIGWGALNLTKMGG